MKINEHQSFSQRGDQEPKISSTKQSGIPIPGLSHEARVLLKEASQDNNGTILYIRHLTGTDLQTNGKNFIS
ncbi:MAG: DUF4062 domain-containing protein, partial [Bacillati bacterium]